MKRKIVANTLLSLGMILALAALLPVKLTFGTPKASPLRYTLIDVGTLGGPNSFFDGPPAPIINNAGVVAGQADTSTPCPLVDIDSTGFVSPAFMWVNGTLTNLGLLPGGCDNFPININASGMIVGVADLPVIDPLTGQPELHADFMYNGQVIDMGTLGGAFSLAGMINDRGQATGFAENADPDIWAPDFAGLFEGFPGTTSFRAFIWQNGTMADLGTLGGPDAAGSAINDLGQIAGVSFTNSVPNPTTGIPTADPFLWSAGRMIDLGTLGGTIGFANAVNNRGQVVGSSNLAGDVTYHAFIWQRGVLTDLGTLGGDTSLANWINEAGEVVGRADLADGTHHAFIWFNGTMTDLGTIDGDPCSTGQYINSKGQAIGRSTNCHGRTLHVFLWDHGSLIDLSSQVLPGSGFVRIGVENSISDTGIIPADAVTPTGEVHAVVLVPHAGATGPGEAQIVATQNHSTAATRHWTNSNTARLESTASTPLERVRSQMRYHYKFPGVRRSQNLPNE
jgi:probable HAF family extracellular repeat protein